MNIQPSFETNTQLAKTCQPPMGSLYYPAMTAQPFIALDAPPGNARFDTPSPQIITATAKVIPLVCVQLVGSAPWPPSLTLTAARLFSSADGVVADRGLCEATLEQASLKRLMMRQSVETFILADSTKLGTASQFAWVPFPAR